MSTKKKIAQATFIIIVFSLFGKLLGFVREIIIAAFFGTTYKTDAYFIGLTGPDFFREIISGGVLAAVFVPLYTSCLARNDSANARKVLNSISTLLIIALLLSVAAGIPLAPYIVKIIAPELDPQTHHMAVRITRILFPSVIFMGLGSFYGSLLNVYKHFASPSLAQLMLNIGIVGGVVALSSRYGIESIAIGFCAGAVLQFLVIMPSLKMREISYAPKLEWSPELRQMFALWVPLFIASIVGTTNDLISRSLAAGLPSGNVAALTFANRIRETIWLLCGVPLGTAVFPFLSSHAANDEKKELEKILSFAVRLTAFMALPVSLLMLFYSRPIVELMFQRGMFDASSTGMTSSALTFYSLGALFYALNYVVLRVYYSIHDVKTPLKIIIFAFVVNIVSGLFLRNYLQVGGITLARSLSDIVTFAFLLHGISYLFVETRPSALYRSMAKTALVSLASIALSYALYRSLPVAGSMQGKLLALGTSWSVGLGCYLALSFAARVGEMNSIWNLVKRKAAL